MRCSLLCRSKRRLSRRASVDELRETAMRHVARRAAGGPSRQSPALTPGAAARSVAALIMYGQVRQCSA
jgi:hypothetical protein